MKYPNEIHKLGEWVDVLDVAEGLMPPKHIGDRITNLVMWMANIRDAGIITRTEHMNIQQRMIHGPGGV